jgi:hypothetical protein
MRFPAFSRWPALALALLVMPGVQTPAGGGELVTTVLAQADDDEPPPLVEPEPAEPDPAEPQADLPDPPRLGDRRRPDPFDAVDERQATPTGPTARGRDEGAVICEAGCDGPRGSVVYKHKLQPPG